MSARILRRDRPEPLYHQLEVQLRDRILAGEWSPGEQIPTEDRLGTVYGVSRVTVRQAIRNLVEGGYLERDQGRGTFVREPTLVAGERGLLSFSDEMEALKLRPGARLLDRTVAPAARPVADRLGIPVGAPVHRLRRLRTGDGKPIGLQTSYLPEARFPGLGERLPEGGSLYRLLQDAYDVVLDEARETFAVAAIEGDDAAALEVRAGACAFHVERIARDALGPFEFTVSLMRGDRYRIQWVLRNPATSVSPAADPPADPPEGATT